MRDFACVLLLLLPLLIVLNRITSNRSLAHTQLATAQGGGSLVPEPTQQWHVVVIECLRIHYHVDHDHELFHRPSRCYQPQQTRQAQANTEKVVILTSVRHSLTRRESVPTMHRGV